ncbi:hypothetical protein [Xanthomonas arboricola]|uniref:hypothetical protein n=1 Tax=Xanthomonas arboricola TaxID=56448 RepID=UPI000E1E7628|nr:hypothetical protein [Xanthomonas arboricola]
MSNTVFIGAKEYFPGIGKIGFEGRDSDNPLAFKVYDANKKIGDKTMAEHLRFAVAYWHSFCGNGADPFGGNFLIEPKPMEPMKHQYDFDSATVIGFLRQHGLDQDFKLNIEANHATLSGHSFEHDLQVASDAGLLGSIDANRGNPQNGWDTDQFPTDLYDTVGAMLVVLRQGGLAPGGLNFDAKVRRESSDPQDLFMAHIGGMDAFARGLEVANALLTSSPLETWRAERYASFDSGAGVAFANGSSTLVDVAKHAAGNVPTQISGRQEAYENLINQYLTR